MRFDHPHVTQVKTYLCRNMSGYAVTECQDFFLNRLVNEWNDGVRSLRKAKIMGNVGIVHLSICITTEE